MRAHNSHKKKIEQIDKETGAVLKIWDSATDAAVSLFGKKNCKKLITSCARHEKPSAYGYKWEYKNKQIG